MTQKRGFVDADKLLESVTCGVILYRLYKSDYHIVTEYINTEAHRVAGFSVEDFQEQKMFLRDMVHPDDAVELYDRLIQTITQGLSYAYELRYVRKQGGYCWVKGTAIAQNFGHDEDGDYILVLSNFYDIDSKKLTEERLRSENDQFRNILASGTYFSYQFDLTVGYLMEDFLTSNGHYALQLLGLPLPCSYDELYRAYFQAFPMILVEGKNKTYSRKELLKAFEAGETSQEQVYYSTRQDMYLRITMYLSKDKYNGHVYALVICRDVTAERQKNLEVQQNMRHALSKAEALNQYLKKEISVVNAIGSVFYAAWTLDLIENKVSAIKEPKDKTLFEQQTVDVQTSIEWVILLAAPEHKTMLNSRLNLANILSELRFKDSFELEYYSLYMGWSRMLIISVERNEIGEVSSLLFGWQGINDQKWKEKEQEKRNRMHIALMADYDYIYYIDLEKDYIAADHFSKAAREVIQDITQRTNSFDTCFQYYAQHIVDEECRPQFSQVFDRQRLIKRLAKDADFAFRYKVQENLSGRNYFEVHVVALTNEPEHHTVVLGARCIDRLINMEMSHQRALEAANQRLKRALEEAKRASEAKSEFLSRMSHDIRTPMNGIVGMANIAQECIEDKKRVKDALDKIQISSHQLNLLINDVLDMSKIESGKIQLVEEKVHLVRLLESILPGLDIMAKRHDVKLVNEGNQIVHPWVMTSTLHLQRIASNILSNAIKYNRDGGSVTYKITEKPLPGEDNKAIYVFEYRDTGIGMSQDFIENKLYQPFAREFINKDIPGTGLGMSIIREIVNMMNGEIRLESKQGVGTTFWVEIPMTIAAETEEDAKNQQRDMEHLLEQKKLLIVDDNEVNLEIATFLLEGHGAKCFTASNGQAALETFCAKGAGYFDLILMDVRMPIMNGLEATKAIRGCGQADAAAIPIIAMTANAFMEDKKKCYEAGMNDHVAKPINVNMLLEVVAKYI